MGRHIFGGMKRNSLEFSLGLSYLMSLISNQVVGQQGVVHVLTY